MAEFTWAKRLSVGNAILDAEHKKLVDLVNAVENAIRSKDRDILPQAFKQLVECVAVHFETEKKIALAISFPFAEHELEHDYVQQELVQMGNEFVNKNSRWSESAAEHYSYFLSTWFIQHLTDEAESMKPALQIYPYDFDPVSGK